jgi:hypothetical protein
MLENRQTGGHRPPLPTRIYPSGSFPCEAESTPGPAGRIRSIKNPNDPPSASTACAVACPIQMEHTDNIDLHKKD